MRARATTIWYVDTPDPAAALRPGAVPDGDVGAALVEQLHPDSEAVPAGACTLADGAGPAVDTVYIGCYPGVTVVCDAQLAIPRPSQLTDDLIGPLSSEHTYLVGLDPELGWGGFAHWQRGVLRRSFSATRINILENEGLPLVWERPFWAGEHPIPAEPAQQPDPQRLPFDPLRFADAANLQWLGFRHDVLAGGDPAAAAPLDPAAVTLCGFTLYPPGEAPAPSPVDTGRRSRWRFATLRQKAFRQKAFR